MRCPVHNCMVQCEAILLAVGVVGAMVHVRYKTGCSLLADSAMMVIVAELAGHVVFYNL
ncbi:MAG: hypothetical protein ACSLEN_01360 [Candidatus Malihini olakiniferum]